jgi:hypothetical protein
LVFGWLTGRKKREAAAAELFAQMAYAHEANNAEARIVAALSAIGVDVRSSEKEEQLRRVEIASGAASSLVRHLRSNSNYSVETKDDVYRDISFSCVMADYFSQRIFANYEMTTLVAEAGVIPADRLLSLAGYSVEVHTRNVKHHLPWVMQTAELVSSWVEMPTTENLDKLKAHYKSFELRSE